jgi:ligand-binding sensor domain-containing protein
MNTRIAIIGCFLMIFGIPSEAQWMQTNAPYYGKITAFAVHDSDIYEAYFGGVYRSTDDGADWFEADSGLTGANHEFTYVTSLATNGKDLFAGTFLTGVFISTNKGVSWSPAGNDLLKLGINALIVDGTNLFAAANVNEDQYGRGVFLSTDSGKSWMESNRGLTDSAVNTLVAFGTNLFAGTDDGVFVSTNNGTTWTPSNSGIPLYFGFNAFALLGTNLFTASNNQNQEVGDGIFLSTDSGKSWMISNKGLADSDVNFLMVSGVNLFAGTDSGVFLSTNNGTSWTSEDTGLLTTTIGLGSIYVQTLAVSGSNLFAGTGNGVWRRPLSDFGTSSVTQTPAITQSEIQIYPNPFSQSTQITFTSQDAGYAKVSIVNMLGVEVAPLSSGELDAGEHNFTWGNPAGLPDGTYECLVRMNGQVETLPIVLLH